MVRKIYHGSKDIIEKPVFGYGKTYNDYGLGFYCTDSLDMAKEWGADASRVGYANCYTMDCDGLSILDLNDDASWQVGAEIRVKKQEGFRKNPFSEVRSGRAKRVVCQENAKGQIREGRIF